MPTPPPLNTTIRITCAMLDANGCYNGPWDLGDNSNTFDIIFASGCVIKICSGGLRTGGSVTIEAGGHVIVYGDVYCATCSGNLESVGGTITTQNP